MDSVIESAAAEKVGRDAQAKPVDQAGLAARQERPEVDIAEQARVAEREGYPFLFSIVMAIYNAERYVEESIESVVAQTIGFSHVELVLVDDGSTDGSAGICASYAQRYPGNVVFVSKENGGVSSARNAGILEARGKYVNFLDSDDLWSADSLEWTLAFFAEHPEVKVAASKFIYFGAIEGDHRLNYKFAEDKVIDLREEYDYPQLSSSTCFFHAELLARRSFNEKLSVSEDVLFVNEILLDEMAYGVMERPVYWYRQRAESDSAVNTMKDNVSWYLDTPELCHRRLFELSRQQHGSVLPFVQYTIMYDLQWRVGSKMSDKMGPEQVARYRDLLVGLLKDIDDHIISEQKTISLERVAYSFALKYGTDMDDILDHMGLEGDMLVSDVTDSLGKEHRISFRPVTALSDVLVIEDVRFDGAHAVVGGYVNTFRFRPRDLQLNATANNSPCGASLEVTDAHKQVNPFDDDIVGKTGFAIRVPLAPGYETRLKADLSILGTEPRSNRFKFAEDLDARAEDCGTFLATSDMLAIVDRSRTLSIYRFAKPIGLDAQQRELEQAIDRYRISLG